jgi:sterol desaturase/sphingolipid hydroxylase (fatty acid hydroxylase superfamily)
VDWFLDTLAGLSPAAAAGWFLAGNVVLVALAIGAGTALSHHANPGRVARPTHPVEAALVGLATLVNAAVAWVGWQLWQHGTIRVTTGTGPTAVIEFAALVLVMDLALYLGHRVAHLRALYPLVHRLHHRFAEPRPATLFALHPAEAAGFGALWIGALAVHAFPLTVIVAYGALNLTFGTLGHLGIEPLPLRWRRHRIFRWIATPTFHETHHRCPATNMGFYTTIWDRLGSTIHPAYDTSRLAAAAASGDAGT